MPVCSFILVQAGSNVSLKYLAWGYKQKSARWWPDSNRVTGFKVQRANHTPNRRASTTVEFQIGWYNDAVQEVFRFAHPYDTLAFVIISTPSMFEKAFIPHLQNSGCSSRRDPLDECIIHYFQKIKQVNSKCMIGLLFGWISWSKTIRYSCMSIAMIWNNFQTELFLALLHWILNFGVNMLLSFRKCTGAGGNSSTDYHALPKTHIVDRLPRAGVSRLELRELPRLRSDADQKTQGVGANCRTCGWSSLLLPANWCAKPWLEFQKGMKYWRRSRCSRPSHFRWLANLCFTGDRMFICQSKDIFFPENLWSQHTPKIRRMVCFTRGSHLQRHSGSRLAKKTPSGHFARQQRQNWTAQTFQLPLAGLAVQRCCAGDREILGPTKALFCYITQR